MFVFLNKNLDVKATAIMFVVLTVSVIGFIIGFGYIDGYMGVKSGQEKEKVFPKSEETVLPVTSEIGMKKFASEEEFKIYLEERQTAATYSSGLEVMGRGAVMPTAVKDINTLQAEDQMGVVGNESTAERVSETNVQVAGVDEPDIVKTDGKEIFLSSLQNLYYPMRDIKPIISTDCAESSDGSVSCAKKIAPMPEYEKATTKIISALPVDKMAVESKIETNGNLLLANNTLVVLGTVDRNITAFDVSDEKNPKETWKMMVSERGNLVNSRLKDGKLYLLVSEYADSARPCPIIPLVKGETNIEVKCTDIYYPTVNTEVDALYTLIAVNAETGEVLGKNSFVGSYNNAQFYMSQDYAYAAYAYSGDMVKFIYDFFLQNRDIVPEWVITKLEKLSSYDLSDSAKMTELNVIISRWQNSMNEDDTLMLENELVNRGEEYYRAHMRDLNYTGIVKFSLSDLSIVATGAVSGQPLNQFSFDEYKGFLRVATTVGQQGFWLAGGMLNSRNHILSDVNVLDSNLKQVGQVRDLGEEGERIYSVRFINDKGYVVTFRQTDPFYVLNLADATNPVKSGELKIPGYSSYLHPLSENLILGIGKEDSNVKLSVFDVSNPAEPKEKSKYTLQEYWSEALNNHHAFLLDSKHKVFFMPGSQGGYIFSYENGLNLKKAVKEQSVERAIYLNDYMYLIGSDKITVLNENTWERAGELSF